MRSWRCVIFEVFLWHLFRAPKLKPALEKRGGKSVKVFLGSNATEAELRQVNSPRILHLATHGFFLPEIELGKSVDPLQPGQEIPKGKLVNPMHRSGLALAGAQTTLEAWARGEVPPTRMTASSRPKKLADLNSMAHGWLFSLLATLARAKRARVKA